MYAAFRYVRVSEAVHKAVGSKGPNVVHMFTRFPRPIPSAHRSTGSVSWIPANIGETIFRITRLQASAMKLYRLIRSWHLGTASLTPPSHDSLLQTFSNANIPLFDPGARDSEYGPILRAISVRLPQHVADYDARYQVP
jgi:hypothetical protein